MNQHSRQEDYEDYEARAIREEQDKKAIDDFWHAYHVSHKKRDIFDEMSKALPLEILVPKRKSYLTQLEEVEEVVNYYYLEILTGKKSLASRWRNEGRENFDNMMKRLNALFEELPRALEESEKSRLSSMGTELRELFEKSSADPGLGANVNVWRFGHSEKSRALQSLFSLVKERLNRLYFSSFRVLYRKELMRELSELCTSLNKYNRFVRKIDKLLFIFLNILIHIGNFYLVTIHTMGRLTCYLELLHIKIVNPFSSKTGDVAITDRLETIYPGFKGAYLEEMMYLYGRDNSWFMRVDQEAIEHHLSLIRDNISRLDE
ncbi:hypothetical protein EAF04_000640 [Stromatinia cepivora]|nr:hypothetical protein EAF04_000640 [Stromatinia cepivora]